MNDLTHHQSIVDGELNAGSDRVRQCTVEIIRDGGDWPVDMRAVEERMIDAVVIAVALAKSSELVSPDIALAKPDPHINIVLSSDKTVRQLNHEFRGMDQSTNVLSFPVGDDGVFGPIADRGIGDVIIAFETVLAEARTRKMPLDHHLTHLAVHGALHLLGLDHSNDHEARKMEELETIILSRMNIPDPHDSRDPFVQNCRLASGE